MKNKIGIFILLFIVSISSCKNGNDSINNKSTKVNKPDTFNIAKKIPVAPTFVIAQDTSHKSAFDDPIKVANNKYSHFDEILMRDLCRGFFRYDGGIDGFTNLTGDDLGGHWLQFFKDGRFEKGQYNAVKTRGKFTVDNLGFIEFIPSDHSEPKSEYQGKFNNDMLILVGTNKHMDNKKQFKLQRISERPKK